MPVRGAHGGPGNRVRDAGTVIDVNHVQTQIDACRSTRRGEHSTVLRIEDRRIELDLREAIAEPRPVTPVGCRPPPVEQARFREDEGTGADRQETCSAYGRPSQFTADVEVDAGPGRIAPNNHDCVGGGQAREPAWHLNREAARRSKWALSPAREADVIEGCFQGSSGIPEDLKRDRHVKGNDPVQGQHHDPVHVSMLSHIGVRATCRACVRRQNSGDVHAGFSTGNRPCQVRRPTVAQALVVVDAQNEFGPGGERTVVRHADALSVIKERIAEARRDGRPIAFVRHHNTDASATAFVPGSWGAEFSPGVGPIEESDRETELVKEVIGAFSQSNLEQWLRERGCDAVLLVGFYAHQCLSTSAREAYVRGFRVAVDPDGTACRPIHHDLLGEQSAEEVRRTALLHLANLGVEITPRALTPEAATAR